MGVTHRWQDTRGRSRKFQIVLVHICPLISSPLPQPFHPYIRQTFLPSPPILLPSPEPRSQGEDPLYIHFLPPLKLLPLLLLSRLFFLLSPHRVHGRVQGEVKRNLEVRRIDGNGAAPAGVRGRHGRRALLLPLDLPGPGSRPAPTDGGGGAEAEPADGDGGAGGDQGGAAAEGPDNRQARRPRAPGGQGAGRGAGQGAAPRATRQASAGGGGGACTHHAAAAGPRAGHVQRHRLRLQPRLVARGPLLRPRHLLRPAPLRQAQPAPAAQAEERRGRGARHARGEEAAAAAWPVPAVRHGGRPAAAEPARRRAAPALAQPAARARARRAPRRRRRPRTLPQRDAPPRAGLRSQRPHDEAADARHGQLLAGIRRQAAQAALTLHHRLRPSPSASPPTVAAALSCQRHTAAPVAHWHHSVTSHHSRTRV